MTIPNPKTAAWRYVRSQNARDLALHWHFACNGESDEHHKYNVVAKSLVAMTHLPLHIKVWHDSMTTCYEDISLEHLL